MPRDVVHDNLSAFQTQHEFEAIFKGHYSHLCAYANGFLQDIDGSEEVVQEVMFQLWLKRHTLSIETSLKSYLFRAVRNRSLNVLKHKRVREDYQARMKVGAEEKGLSVEEGIIGTELSAKIREAIDLLPAGRKQIFLLSRYEGLTNAQIADRLGISVKTVENQMTQALRHLREELKEYLPLLVWLMVVGSGRW